MQNKSLTSTARFFDALSIVGSILILVSLSTDIISVKSYRLSLGMMDIQLIICLIFIADYIVHTLAAPRPRRYFWRNMVLLLVSLPYLHLCSWFGIEIGKGLYIIFKCLPLIRGMVGIYSVIRIVTPSRVSAVMWSYIAIIIMMTYLAALLFFAYEEDLNVHVVDFGASLWWAGLNITTVGANFFAVTPIGKILTVILPGLGMILFPLLTVYATSWVQREVNRDKPK